MKKSYGMDGAMDTIKKNLPTWLEQTAEIPHLVHELLSLKTKPLTKLQQIEQAKSDKQEQHSENKKTYALLASGFGIMTSIIYVFDTSRTAKYLDMSFSVLFGIGLTFVFLYKAIKK
jgi:hypothetical protein